MTYVDNESNTETPDNVWELAQFDFLKNQTYISIIKVFEMALWGILKRHKNVTTKYTVPI